VLFSLSLPVCSQAAQYDQQPSQATELLSDGGLVPPCCSPPLLSSRLLSSRLQVDKSYEATEMHALEHSEVEVAASPRAAGGVSSPFQPMYAGSNDEAATTSYDDAAEEMAAVRIQATVRGQQARARAGGGGAADLL